MRTLLLLPNELPMAREIPATESYDAIARLLNAERITSFSLARDALICMQARPAPRAALNCYATQLSRIERSSTQLEIFGPALIIGCSPMAIADYPSRILDELELLIARADVVPDNFPDQATAATSPEQPIRLSQPQRRPR